MIYIKEYSIIPIDYQVHCIILYQQGGGVVEISMITRGLKPQCVLTPLPPGKKILFTLPGQIPIYPITGNQIGVV